MPYERRKKIRDERFGGVYEAFDTRLESSVSLKVLHEHLREDPQALARFEREAQTLSRLQLDSVPKIMGFEHADGELPTLVLEPLRGTTLEDMNRGSGNLWSRLSTLREACFGVELLHQQGITHRDLKPFNLLKNDHGAVQMLDLGLAQRSYPLAAGSGTRPIGSILGTPEYMSPEQVRGMPVDARSDVFSLGVTLFVVLTNENPFARESVTETLVNVTRGEMPGLMGKYEVEPFGAVVKRALSVSPGDRFFTAAELAQALEPLIDRASRFEDTFLFRAVRR